MDTKISFMSRHPWQPAEATAGNITEKPLL